MARRLQLMAVGVLALAAVVAAVVVNRGGATQPAGGAETGAAEVRGLFAGIPQDGFAAGERRAPVTLVEFGDLQCPFCAEFATQTLPALMDEYVRAGELRVEFRPLAFIGEDSVEAARAAAAASLQDRGLAFTHLAYLRQGMENSGYVTDGFLREVAGGVPGLDVERVLSERGSHPARDLLVAAEDEAQAAGIDATPAFLIRGRSGPSERLEAAPGDLETFRAAIERLLGR